MSTVVELKKIAKARGLTGYSKLRKDELVALLGVSAKNRKNCTKTVKVVLIPSLQSSGRSISGASLTALMMNHIKKVVKSDYQYLDGGNGNVKVTVRETKGKRLNVTLCGKNVNTDREFLESVDDDGNHPYTLKGEQYLVSVQVA